MTEQLAPLHRHPTRVAVFRFSALTWNAHRIHFDDEFARNEGLPGAVVQSHLHGSYLAQAALRWGGPAARLLRLSWRPLRPVLAGERVVITGRVVARHGDGSADIELAEATVDGAVCVTGTATVLPGRGDRP